MTESVTEATLQPVRAGALVLKIFTFITRGTWRERERRHIAEFIERNIDCSELTPEKIDTWMRKLPTYFSGIEEAEAEYQRLARSLSPTLRAECRVTALAIARGSGRRPIDPALIAKINADFTG